MENKNEMKNVNEIKKVDEMKYICKSYFERNNERLRFHSGYEIVYYNEKEISRDENGSVIEFPIDMNYISDKFINKANYLINKDNADDIFNIYKKYVGTSSYKMKKSLPVIFALLNIYTNKNFSYDSIFNILKNQSGYGYMGGVGCGKNIHKLTFDKIIGVKSGLSKEVNELAEFWLAGMMEQLYEIRKNKKYLREVIEEKDLFVALNAKPDCQETVAHVNSQGFVIKNATKKDITCKKCLKK
jgi:hypothetical protein